MRKIDHIYIHSVRKQYEIKCEFCDIRGIKVDFYDVVNLDSTERHYSMVTFPPADWHRCRVKTDGLGD